MKVRFKTTDRVLVPEDVYDAQLISIEPVKTKHNDALRWVFAIVNNEQFENQKVSGITPPVPTTDGNKFTKWIAKFGIDIDSFSEGDDFDYDDLIGEMIRINVEMNDEGTYSNVVSLKSFRPSSAPPAKKRHVEEEEETPKPKKRPVEPEEDEEEPKPKKRPVESEKDDVPFNETPKPKKHIEEEEEKPKQKRPKHVDPDNDEEIPPKKDKGKDSEDEEW